MKRLLISLLLVSTVCSAQVYRSGNAGGIYRPATAASPDTLSTVWYSYLDTAGVGGDDPYSPRVIRGNYIFWNSAWGHIYVPADSTFWQSYRGLDSINPAAMYAYDFHQYDNDNVKGFPNVGWGYNGYEYATVSTPQVPFSLLSIDSMMADFNIVVHGSDSPLHQSMFDIWLADSVWATGYRRTWEIMITVLDSSGWSWSWNPADDTVTIAGMQYFLAVDSSGAWEIAHFRRASQYPDSTIDLNDFFDCLIDSGYVDSTELFVNLGFGTEPIQGRGSAYVTLNMTVGLTETEETGGYLVLDAEEGDLSETDGQVQEGTATIAASALADTFGTYGFRSTGDTTSRGYAYKAVDVSGDTSVYMRFYMRLDSDYVATGTNGNIAIAQLAEAAYGYNIIVLLVTGANATTGPFSIALYTADGTAVRFRDAGTSTISKGVWHRVELAYTLSATAGSFTLWVDGTQIGTATGLITTKGIAGVKFGWSDDYGTAGPAAGKWLDFDNIKVSGTPIGQYVP